MGYQENYSEWINNPNLDANLKDALLRYSEKEIEDAFYCDIEFGTAGMRGLMGPGTNRINKYTILKACQGFANYLIKNSCSKVAIAYDNRNNSKEFANYSAKLLAKNKINVYIFDSLRPTPELSFAVRYLHCDGGIMITASHNPKEYNGFKLYDKNGCQNIPKIANAITNEVNKIKDVFSLNIDSNYSSDLIHIINKDVDNAYYNKVLDIQLRPNLNKDIRISFSPEHGASFVPVMSCLKKAGYNVKNVEKESKPDGNFPNITSPNPEERDAYIGVIEQAKKEKSDLMLVCDPDGDRMGVAIPKNDDYYIFNGNQTGAILLEYILSTHKEHESNLSSYIMFNTIVTSDIGEAVAKHYGVKCEKTLTGFKYIGDKIQKNENTGKKYIFGYEESYGSLISPFVRDKDATQACLMLAEACQYYKTQNKDLLDVLNDIFSYSSSYFDTQFSIKLDGAEGKEKLENIMNDLRNRPPLVNGFVIKYYEDYLLAKRVYKEKIEEITGYDKTNVLKYYLDDGCFVAIRPSGTEPKCKVYISTCGSSFGDAALKAETLKNTFSQIIK